MNGTANATLVPLKESLSIQVIKFVACLVILLIALVGNILIIIVVHQNTSLKKTINYFILNMAASDLIVPLFILPRVMVETATNSTQWQATDGLLGQILCKFIFFVSDITMVVSILSLICIAVDRFCAVVFPLKVAYITSRIRVGLIAFTWIFSLSYFSVLFYSMRLETIDGRTECILRWSENPVFHTKVHTAFVTTSAVLFIIIPTIILTFLYTAILIVVRTQIVSKHEQQGNSASRAANNNKLLKLAILTVGAFAVCYGPFNIYVFYATFILDWKIADYQVFQRLKFAGEFLTYANSALNPCLYFIFIEKFRRGLMRVLKCRHRDNRSRLQTTDSKTTRMVRLDTTIGKKEDKESSQEKDSLI